MARGTGCDQPQQAQTRMTDSRDPGAPERVRVGRSKRVHIVRGTTIYSRVGYHTTCCGYYGAPKNGWMVPTEDEATCKSCIANASAPS